MRRLWRLSGLLLRTIVVIVDEGLRSAFATRTMVAESSRMGLGTLTNSLVKVGGMILGQALPLLWCVITEFSLRRNLGSAEEKGWQLREEDQAYLNVSLEDLQLSHEIELERRATAQQRVQGNAATIAVVTSLLAAALAILKDDLTNDQDTVLIGSWVRILLTGAVLWLVMSGISAIRTIGITKQFDNWLQTRDTSVEGGNEETLKKTRLIKMVLLNQGYTMIAMNNAIASFRSMRNAFLAMGIVVIMVLWSV